jgi:hypothetical protein
MKPAPRAADWCGREDRDDRGFSPPGRRRSGDSSSTDHGGLRGDGLIARDPGCLRGEATLLYPATYCGPVLCVPFNSPQGCFLDGNHEPVDVSNCKRQEKQRPCLNQEPCLSEIGESEPDVHGIAREPVRSSGHQLFRGLARHGGSCCLAEQQQAPSRKACPGKKQDDPQSGWQAMLPVSLGALEPEAARQRPADKPRRIPRALACAGKAAGDSWPFPPVPGCPSGRRCGRDDAHAGAAPRPSRLLPVAHGSCKII